jgi:hypothetical protein
VASPAYQRRNARARALGYRSYYDYRAHGNGARPPSAPKLSGEKLRQARGHASAADLRRASLDGALVTTIGEGRKADGSYERLRVIVVDLDGRQREYVLRGKQARQRQLRQTVAAIDAAGAVFSPSPSLDLQTMIDEPDDFDVEAPELQLDDDE